MTWTLLIAIGVMAVAVLIGDRLLDWWLDKELDKDHQLTMSWDETQRWAEICKALEPDIEKATGGTDYLEYYDFRRAQETDER